MGVGASKQNDTRRVIIANSLSKLINSGLESNVYRVKDKSGHDLILKKRRPAGKQNYLFEAYAYRQLAALGALVPQIVQASPEELLMTQLTGREMDDQVKLYTDEQLFADIASNLALCSEVKFQGFGHATQQGDSFAGEYSTWADFLDTSERLFESPNITVLGERDISKLHNKWSAQKSSMHLDQGALVHGDFSMSSIFVEGHKLAGIIDFGDAFIGDPLMDIAYFRFKEITKPYGDGVYERLLRHYAEARKLAITIELEQKIVFYMIYWGLKRLERCPDKKLMEKFRMKLRVVANEF